MERGIIPWSPDLEITRRTRPHIPWKSDVGTWTKYGQEIYMYPTQGSSMSGGASSEGIMVIGAIAIAIVGIYLWINKAPKLPEPQ